MIKVSTFRNVTKKDEQLIFGISMMNRSIHILVPPHPTPNIIHNLSRTHSWSLVDATPAVVLPCHICLTRSWLLADTTPAVLPVHGHWLMPHLLLS